MSIQKWILFLNVIYGCVAFCAVLTFYPKFVYILCTFCPVRSFNYSWNNNLIKLYVLKEAFSQKKYIFFFLKTWFCLVFELLPSEHQYNKYWLSCFNVNVFPQLQSNVDEHTLAQLSFSTKYQHWNNIGSSTLSRRWFNVDVFARFPSFLDF